MKIIVLHGDDTQKSYERLKKFIDTAKERSWEVAYLDDSDAKIEEQLSSSSLFGNERFFILKDLSKLGKKEIGWINKKSDGLDGNLIIYHDALISKTFLNSIKKITKIEEFKLPVLLWNFLDGLYPGNAEKSVKTLHKIIEKEPVEMVFSLITKHFRNLYWAKVEPKTMIIQPWRISKLQKQASNLTIEQLAQFIDFFADIDIKVKTSKADLLNELDLFIIKHLE